MTQFRKFQIIALICWLFWFVGFLMGWAVGEWA